MKFTVQRDDFYLAVNSVQRATATRVIQPILANILIECESSTAPLKLSATDLDFSLQTSLNAEISIPGRATLSAKKLSEILAKLPSKAMVQFEIDPVVQSCHISCGSSVFDMRTLPAEEFPSIPVIDSSTAIELSLPALVQCIKQTEFAASKTDTNNILGGVFFKLSSDGLDLVSTDGSRLARRKESLEGLTLAETVTAIIPARTLQEFMKLAQTNAGEQTDTALVAIQNGQVFLSTTRFNAVSRLLDGQYPRYEQLIPRECKLQAKMNRAALTAALERTAVMANERTSIVRMTLSQGQLVLAADTPDVGNSKDMMPIHYDATEDLTIAFNFHFVLGALKVMDGDDLLMETNGALAPTLFKDADTPDAYLCLVMPVQVK
ncbi:MAG: DNA polymerase III subunit beta [Candidatus Melainabacteria bacterium]|jgi:DNA polymerase-3 subunit beta|nr:DNA polymerase III subunit beta [Candidatus Melainabacteria bacterium]